MMLGKDKMAEPRAIARWRRAPKQFRTLSRRSPLHQGQSLPANPPAVAALPAPQRKKLPLKKAKRADELDEENRGLKTKIDELQLDAVQVLISSFGAVFL